MQKLTPACLPPYTSFLCKSELLLVVSRSYLPVYRSNVVWQLVVGKAPVAIPPKKEAWLPAIF